MTELENFIAAVRIQAAQCGLTEVETEEASGALIETEALRAMTDAGGSVLAIGDPGTGKTLAAIRWLIRPLYDLRDWYLGGDVWLPKHRKPWPFLFRPAKSLSRIAQYDEKAVEPLFSAARLVVDDLGQEYLDKSGFLVSLIDEIVSERHRRRLPTVMTANLTAEEFQQRYGKRVVDRIAGAGRLVVCGGDSLRRKSTDARTVPALVAADALIERRTELAAAAAKVAAEHVKRLDAQERAWMAERVARGPSRILEPKSPPRVTMTEAEVQARKDQIARDLEEWRQRNPQTEPTS